MNETGHCVTNLDRCRLGKLLEDQDRQAWGTAHALARLEALLEQAQVVEPELTPAALVTMNSTVELEDLRTNDVFTKTLVYPEDVDLTPDSVSIFEPLGIALLGCQVGDLVECPEDTEPHLRVKAILYQPEGEGNLFL
jgi:regulator of nucleoside diphosphate kinase